METAIMTLKAEISRLRSKLEIANEPNLLTVLGVAYHSPEATELKRQIREHENAVDVLEVLWQWQKNNATEADRGV